jgi:hypothetical protein
VLSYGRFRNQIFFTELSSEAATIKMATGAIALDGARRSRVPGVLVAVGSVFNGEGIFAVGPGRDRSRRVVSHAQMITRVGPLLYVIPSDNTDRNSRVATLHDALVFEISSSQQDAVREF